MIYSMTGYGKVAISINNKRITAELRSVNSKQLDLSVRVPQSYHSLELPLRNELSQMLHRGKVDLTISTETLDGGTAPVSLNLPVLADYKRQVEQMSAELNIPVPDDWYATLLRLPDVMKVNSDATDEIDEEEATQVVELACAAADAMNDFRRQEGARLADFFEQRIQAIGDLLDRVPQYEQARVDKIRGRLEDGLERLEGVEYDKNRLEQELIFYIEKLDITEEKLRLRNHLKYFLETLRDGEQQGKKLGFISQEIGREINTMGSKANEANIQRLVVMMKDNLEQIKEQVLNVL